MTSCSTRSYMTECDVMTIPTGWLRQGDGSALACWGFCNKVQQTGRLRTGEICSHIVLETKRPRSRCQHGHVPFGSSEGSIPGLSSSSQQFLGLRQRNSNLNVVLSQCMCWGPSFPFLMYIWHTGLQPTLFQYDLIVTNYICKDPIPK